MPQVNPYASFGPETVHSQDSASARQLSRCRFAVVLVILIASLVALGYALRGAREIAEFAKQPHREIAENPFLRSLADVQHQTAPRFLCSGIVSFLTVGLLAVFAYRLGVFSSRLRKAALGGVELHEVIIAQTSCWMLLAIIAVLLFVRPILPFIN